MRRDRLDWNEAIRRRFRQEYGEWLPEDRISELLEAARLERISGSASDDGYDASHSIDLVFDDLRSIAEDYERAFLSASASQAASDLSDWTSLPAPASWTARTHGIMRRYLPLQDAMLVMFGLTTVITAKEIPRVLEAAVDADAEEGDVVAIALPPELDDDVVIGRLGIHMNPWLLAMRYSMKREQSPDPARFPTYDAWLAERQAGLLQRLTRVGKLSFVIDHMVKETGCEPWQALAYLLCGRVPELPWVRVRREHRVAVGDTWVIEVAAPGVPARDVQKAYVAARDAFETASGGEADESSAGTPSLYDFVRPLREQDVPWHEIRALWNAQPGVHQYEKTKTLEVAYLRARRQREE